MSRRDEGYAAAIADALRVLVEEGNGLLLTLTADEYAGIRDRIAALAPAEPPPLTERAPDNSDACRLLRTAYREWTPTQGPRDEWVKDTERALGLGNGPQIIPTAAAEFALVAAGMLDPSEDDGRHHHLTWNGTEWVDDRCGCRYHPDDDRGTHGGAPHVHPCSKHADAPPTERAPLADALAEWCRTYGAALCPRPGRADTFGEGMCVAKDEVARILERHRTAAPLTERASRREGRLTEALERFVRNYTDTRDGDDGMEHSQCLECGEQSPEGNEPPACDPRACDVGFARSALGEAAAPLTERAREWADAIVRQQGWVPMTETPYTLDCRAFASAIRDPDILAAINEAARRLADGGGK